MIGQIGPAEELVGSEGSAHSAAAVALLEQDLANLAEWFVVVVVVVVLVLELVEAGAVESEWDVVAEECCQLEGCWAPGCCSH